MNGGRFDFDDGGTYCGGWEDGKAHGHGVCTGPKGQGEYSGAWHYGFEVSGVYTWPSGNCYEGQWQNGKRHGLGDERRGRWVYRGEWTQGYKGRYGLRQSTNSQAKYEGTWANGLQDGYGTETYADGGTYQGQWLRGMRHGYGSRRSAPYGVAAKYRSRSHAHASLTSLRSDQGGDENVVGSSGHDGKDKSKADDSRGGFVLRARSEPPSRRRSLSERSVAVKRTILQGLRIKKQRSAGDINQRVAGTGSIRSSGSTASCASDESGVTGYSHDHGSFVGVEEFVDPNATETYMGEWKNDKRSGFGVSERSDGLKYEGEWFNNKKFGYGVTTFKDGTKEEGKYKNNILITSQRKKNLLFVRSSKLRERIDSAVSAATRAAQIAVQKADIAMSRSATARDRAEQADLASLQAREDSDIARLCAKQFAPDFQQPGAELLKKRQQNEQMGNHVGGVPKGGARSISLYIPKHTGGPNFVGPNVPSELVQQPAAAVTTPPMFTPPEEQPPPTTSSASHLPSQQQPQRHPLQAMKQLTFEEQSSLASTGDVIQNDSSVITTVHASGPESNLVRLSDEQQHHFAMQSNITVRQHGPASTPQFQQLSNLQRVRQQQADAQFHRMDVPADYYLPSASTSMAPTYAEAGVSGGFARQLQQQQQQQGARYRNSPLPPGRQSPTISRTPSQSSSKYSLNQVLYDHFDQYSMAANPSAAKLIHANVVRQQQSPVRTPMGEGSASATLIRRSTLASSRDWKGLPPHMDVSKAEGEGTSAGARGEYEYSVEVIRRPAALKLFSREYAGESRGSMPDIAELEKTPVQMSREEVARLGSHRRQELQRMQEEAELLRSNPFRYLRYLYHPSVRAWIVRWKLPLLILFVNACLSFMFYRLLTYSKDETGEGDSDGRQ